MKVTSVLLAAFCLASIAHIGSAQTAAPKWSLETELVQPFIPNVGIMRLQAARPITGLGQANRGDLLLGAYIRPNVTHDIVDKISEYALMVGYRQYLWRGLHLEAKTNVGFSEGLKNKIDQKDYTRFSWFWEANAGYRFLLTPTKQTGFYVLPQAGVISSIASDIGPRGGEPDTFFQANLIVGFQF